MLFRAASHSAELELELTRRNVPFVKFGGLKFLEAAHVKDLLAILRFAENPRDRVAGSRVLELLPGIGEATAESILASLDAASGEAAALATARVPRAAAEHWPAFMELFELLRRGSRVGRPRSRQLGSGIGPTWSRCTRMPRSAPAIWNNWFGWQRAFPPARAS